MTKPIIIKCRWLPTTLCVNIFGTLWARRTDWIDKYVINHERIHTAQQRELLFVPFYIIYVAEWLVRLVWYRNHKLAYRNISFEREAYANQDNLFYLSGRRHYAWLRRYLRRKRKLPA